jgi:hypothetical protein
MTWGAVIVAGGALIGGVTASQGAKKAGKAAAGSADAATAEQQRQFDQLREDQAPYREIGTAALGDINYLYGRGTPNGAPDMSRFFTSPDYQFNLEQGQQAVDRSMLARGRGLSGAAVKEGTRFASGLASSEFGNYYNRLASQAGIGQSSTNFTGQAGMNAAANIGGYQVNAGNARASAYMAGAEGVNNSIQGGIGNYLTMQYMKPPQAYGGFGAAGYQGNTPYDLGGGLR